MVLICYLVAVALNILWLLKGDELPVDRQMLIPVLSVVTAGIGVFLRTRYLGETGRVSYRRKALWVLLVYYLAILSVLLIFGGLFHVDRAWGSAINLEPFYTIRRFWIHFLRTGSPSSLSNLLGNVVILMPLGVLLPVMSRTLRRFWLTLPLLALVAVGVELLQWLTAAGIADVDDSILNFSGAAVGYVLTRLCQRIYLHFKGAKP